MEIGHPPMLPQTASRAVTATTDTQVALNASQRNDATADGPAPFNGAVDSAATFQPFGKDGFGFDDFLDIVNPLQHIPIVSTLYRQLTGDTIEGMPRILGGALFGGPVGGGLAIADVMVRESSGKFIGDHVYAGVFDDTNPDVALAEAGAETASGTDGQAGAAMAPDPQTPTPGQAWYEDVIAGFAATEAGTAGSAASQIGTPQMGTAVAQDSHPSPHPTPHHAVAESAPAALPWYSGAIEGLRRAEALVDAGADSIVAKHQIWDHQNDQRAERQADQAAGAAGTIRPGSIGGGGFSDAMLGALLQAQEHGFLPTGTQATSAQPSGTTNRNPEPGAGTGAG